MVIVTHESYDSVLVGTGKQKGLVSLSGNREWRRRCDVERQVVPDGGTRNRKRPLADCRETNGRNIQTMWLFALSGYGWRSDTVRGVARLKNMRWIGYTWLGSECEAPSVVQWQRPIVRIFHLLGVERKQQIRLVLRILQISESSPKNATDPLNPRKNSRDLHQSQEQPLAKVKWTCRPSGDASGHHYGFFVVFRVTYILLSLFFIFNAFLHLYLA